MSTPQRTRTTVTPPPVPTEELEAMLTRLRLPTIRDRLDALLEEAARHGHSVQYVSAMELISALAKAQAQQALEARLTQYAKSRLLIIDELGYLPLEPNAAYLFFQLISRCYQRGSVLITSNWPVMEWGEVFGDQVVATAILDRLLHHSHVLTIRGDSFRLREKRRSGA